MLKEAIESLEGDLKRAQEAMEKDDMVSVVYWLKSANLTIQRVFEESEKQSNNLGQ